MKVRRNLVLGLIISLFALTLVSCSLPGSEPLPQSSATVDINATLADISMRETVLAMPSNTALPSQTILPSETATFTLQPTLTAPPTLTATIIPSATLTFTPFPTETPLPTATIPSPTPNNPQLTATRQVKMQSANILVYEDVVQESELIPRIDKSLTNLGMTGANVINVRDAAGDFLYYLNSDTNWDLIIFSQESRRQIDSGLIGALLPHIKNNGALILESWNLDLYARGDTLELLNYCGIEIQRDHYRPNDYDYLDFFIYDFQSGSQFLHTPNAITFPLEPSPYWQADVGDVLQLAPGSDATLLAGIWSGDPTTYGLLASCLDGRVIIQSFSSHDYLVNDTTDLYENYITNTLQNHFKAIE